MVRFWPMSGHYFHPCYILYYVYVSTCLSLNGVYLCLSMHSYYSFGPIFLEFSPQYVMYSGWVGDNDPTFDGMEHALKSYLQSAWAGSCPIHSN